MEEEVEMRDDEDRVGEWEDGLPNADDLTPLSQLLITPELASAFSITPEPCRTITDVNHASRTTISSLWKQNQAYAALPPFRDQTSGSRDPVVVQDENDEHDNESKIDNSEKRKSSSPPPPPPPPREESLDPVEEDNSAFQTDTSNDDQSAEARTLKRARLVWTPQLHKRFVEVVRHLGIKNAVPKTIMQLMNVEGLTRENVASHLQKYRLYVKRMPRLSNEAAPPSDHLFASTPVPPSLNKQSTTPLPPQPVPIPIQVPYVHHPLIPMPLPSYHPHHYNMYMEQQRDWSGNRFGSVVSHHHISPNNK